MRVISLVLITLEFISESNGARILGVFPTASFSHQIVFRALTNELARRGHNVVNVTPYPDRNNDTKLDNLTQVDTSEVTIQKFINEFGRAIKVDGDHENNLLTHELFLNVLTDTFEDWLATDEMKNIMKERFDLIIVEACSLATLVLSDRMKAPIVQISSFSAIHPNSYAIGSGSHPLLYPEPTRKRVLDLSFMEKLDALLYELKIFLFTKGVERRINSMIERNFGEKTPKIEELYNNLEVLFVNTVPVWDINKAVPPRLVHVGGLHLKEKKELPKELKSNLDSSKHGVIYMSFGTNVDPRTLSPRQIQVFSNVFARMPYDVLWKYNGVLIGKPDNVNTSEWWLQADLLRHPKVKLFITHGGLQSSEEAIEAGVPVIITPMFGDQWYNAEQLEKYGVGKLMHFPTLTEDDLRTSIEEVIGNISYKENMKRLKKLLRDQPQPSIERAVWWTEHVLRHGGAKHLRSPLASVSWSEYLLLDVVLVLLVLFMMSWVMILNVYRFIGVRCYKIKYN